MKRLVGVVGLVAYLASSGVAVADSDKHRAELIAAINAVLSDGALKAKAMEAGKDRSLLCGNCHGVDGNSKKSDIPNLAGQHPGYLFEQIGKFADGVRKNFVMQTLSKNFTDEDKINLAAYYSNQTVKPIEINEELAARGGTIFQRVCVMCHGEDGKGEEGYARLAGQQHDYVVNTLRRFRSNAASNGSPADKSKIARTNARMEQVTQNLSDQDIEGLAAYIGSLR